MNSTDNYAINEIIKSISEGVILYEGLKYNPNLKRTRKLEE